MKLYYFIERAKINHLKDKNHLTINGWAVCENGKLPHLEIIINSNSEEYDFSPIPRPDVCKKYQLDSSSLQNGFRLFLDIKEEIKSIQLIAHYDEEKKMLYQATKEEIKNILVEDTVEYAIDGVHKDEDAGIQTISGWAFSYYQENIEYQVIDDKGNKIDSNVRVINREDLYRLKYVNKEQKYCGFMISYPAENKNKYYLIIQTNTFKKKIDLSKVNYESFLAKIKRYLRMINGENIKKGIAYLKKYGFVKFLKRVKRGPTNQLTYADWFEQHRVSQSQLKIQKETHFEFEPKISIIVPTYNTPLDFLKEMIDSVRNQSYANWQLCIADGSDENHPARKTIGDYAKEDQRIKVTYLSENYGISGNTNKALEIADGDYVGLFDHDDLLTPDALFEIVSSLQEKQHDIIYTDEVN